MPSFFTVIAGHDAQSCIGNFGAANYFLIIQQILLLMIYNLLYLYNLIFLY